MDMSTVISHLHVRRHDAAPLLGGVVGEALGGECAGGDVLHQADVLHARAVVGLPAAQLLVVEEEPDDGQRAHPGARRARGGSVGVEEGGEPAGGAAGEDELGRLRQTSRDEEVEGGVQVEQPAEEELRDVVRRGRPARTLDGPRLRPVAGEGGAVAVDEAGTVALLRVGRARRIVEGALAIASLRVVVRGAEPGQGSDRAEALVVAPAAARKSHTPPARRGVPRKVETERAAVEAGRAARERQELESGHRRFSVFVSLIWQNPALSTVYVVTPMNEHR